MSRIPSPWSWLSRGAFLQKKVWYVLLGSRHCDPHHPCRAATLDATYMGPPGAARHPALDTTNNSTLCTRARSEGLSARHRVRLLDMGGASRRPSTPQENLPHAFLCRKDQGSLTYYQKQKVLEPSFRRKRRWPTLWRVVATPIPAHPGAAGGSRGIGGGAGHLG